MALFSWKKKGNADVQGDDIVTPAPLPDEELPPSPPDPRWEELMTEVAENHHFKLVTFDGLFWIDPFNGELISAPFDLDQAIQEHFSHRDHWRDGQALKAVQLYAQRWMLWFNEDRGADKRFQFFHA